MTDRRRFLTRGAIAAAVTAAASGAGIVAGAKRASAGISGGTEPSELHIGRQNENLNPGGTTELHGGTANNNSSLVSFESNSAGADTNVLLVEHIGGGSAPNGISIDVSGGTGGTGHGLEATINNSAGGFAVLGTAIGSGGTQIGVQGTRLANPGGIAVRGFANTLNAVGVSADSLLGPALSLTDNSQTMPPTTGSWTSGSFVHSGGTLWFCVDGGTGTDSKWVRLTSVFVPLAAPQRIYYSATSPPGTKITHGEERTISALTDGHVPAGASAVSMNLAVIATTGTSGFLAVFPADQAYPGHSNLNWFGANQILANSAVTSVDGAGDFKVRCGTNGNTHFVVDILGYYT
jgi:hypothetical protein